MDEPTNDLDMETLELLEELLADYPGTLLLVSHDREFLDNVVTSTLVMQDGGEGRIGEYVGGYSDWLSQGPSRHLQGQTPREQTATTQAKVATKQAADAAAAPPPAEDQPPPGFKQERQLKHTPARPPQPKQ